MNAFVTLTLPELSSCVTPVAGVLYIGEIPITFWLLIWGARPLPEATTPGASAAA